MRIAIVILALAAIAVTLVHLRRRQTSFAHEIQSLQSRQVTFRRKLWDQQTRLGYLTSPRVIHQRVELAVGVIHSAGADATGSEELTALGQVGPLKR